MTTYSRGVRTIALVEGAKGALVLAAGCGLLGLVHHDVQGLAEKLVRHSHLNPASHYPRIFLELAAKVNDGNLWMLALVATLYGVLRFIEAYGLWRERRWAEWFAAISGGVYIPIELYELAEGINLVKLLVLAVNCLVVAYMAYVLWRSKTVRHQDPAEERIR